MPIADLGDVQLHYKRRGAGTPVLGIMGFSLDQRFWAAQIPAVTKNNEFVTFDNRGVGRSTGETVTSIEDMADDAVRLLDHLELDEVVVFGVSMGGTIAQRLVIEHPERVKALILAVTWARPIEFMRRQHELTRNLISAVGLDALIDGSLIRMFSPEFFEIGQEMVDRMVRGFLTEQPDEKVILSQLDALDRHDALADLKNVSCPTLVMGGKMDMMVPYLASEEIARTIPGAELATFEKGHGCMIEEMSEFNHRVEEFLSQF